MLQRKDGLPSSKKSKKNVPIIRTVQQGTLGGFLQKAQRSLLTSIWQVIQVTQTNTPGEFKIWALVCFERFCLIWN